MTTDPAQERLATEVLAEPRAAPDPDRNRLLNRKGIEAEAVDPIELACEARILLGPELLEQLDLFVAAAPPRRVVRAERRIFLATPADADPHAQPPAG